MSDQVDARGEREFLLRSLDDLEAERDAGNIDDATYRVAARRLHRARGRRDPHRCDDGVEPIASRSRTRASRWHAGSLTVGGHRRVRGASPRSGSRVRVGHARSGRDDHRQRRRATPRTSVDGSARAAAEERPDDYAARIAYRARCSAPISPAALERVTTPPSRIDPTQPEPPTYMGWINAVGREQTRGRTPTATPCSRRAIDYARPGDRAGRRVHGRVRVPRADERRTCRRSRGGRSRLPAIPRACAGRPPHARARQRRARGSASTTATARLL